MADTNPFAVYVAPDAASGTAPPAGSVDQEANPFAQFVPLDQLAPQSSILSEQKNIGQGVRQGMMDIPVGGTQAIMHAGAAIAPETLGPEAARVDQYAKQREADYLKSLGGKAPSIDLGRAFGNAVVGSPFAYLMPGAAAETLGPRILSGIASGALTGAAQPVDTSQGDFATQKGEQTLAGAAGGALAIPPVGATARTISGATNPNVKLLASEGVSPTIGQIVGKWFGPIEEKLGSIPAVGDVIANARRHATEDLNRAAINRSLSHVGETLDKGTPLGREAISEMHDKIGGAYDKLLPNLIWQADPQFVNNVTNIRNSSNLLPDQEKQFDNFLHNQFSKVSPNGTLPGETYKEVESTLRSQARNYLNTADPDQRNLGKAFQGVQVELRNALRRSNPQYAPQLDSVDAAYADALRVQTAAARQGAEEGIFSGPQLASAVRQMDPSLRKGAYARGEARMQDLSDAAKSVLGNKVPDSGTAGRSLAALGAGALVGGGGVEHIMPHLTLPTAAAILGGLSAYTNPGRKTLATLLASRPDIAAPIASVVRRAGGALVPPGLASVLAQRASPP